MNLQSLQIVNKRLAAKLDLLKAQQPHSLQLAHALKNFSIFFHCFQSAWNQFLSKQGEIYRLTAQSKESKDRVFVGQLSHSYKKMTQILFNLPQKIYSENSQKNTKQLIEYVDSFMRHFHQIQLQLVAEHLAHQQRLRTIEETLVSKEDGFLKAYMARVSELRAQFTELEETLQSMKIDNSKYQVSASCEKLGQYCQQLIQQNTNLKGRVQQLQIRLRQLIDLNNLSLDFKSIQSQEYACVCGGYRLTMTLSQTTDKYKRLLESKDKELKLKDSLCQKNNKRIDELLLKLQSYRQDKRNAQRNFARSPVIMQVCSKAEQIFMQSLEWASQLWQMKTSQTSLQGQRLREISQLRRKFNQEKQSLNEKIVELQRKGGGFQFQDNKTQIQKEWAQLFERFREINLKFSSEVDQAQLIRLLQLREAELSKEVKAKSEQSQKLQSKLLRVQEQNLSMKITFKPESKDFTIKYQKAKILIGKISNLMEKYPELKDQWTEFVKYFKFRQDKINKLKKEELKLKAELEKEERMQKSLQDNYQIVLKVCDQHSRKSVQLLQQLRLTQEQIQRTVSQFNIKNRDYEILLNQQKNRKNIQSNQVSLSNELKKHLLVIEDMRVQVKRANELRELAFAKTNQLQRINFNLEKESEQHRREIQLLKEKSRIMQKQVRQLVSQSTVSASQIFRLKQELKAPQKNTFVDNFKEEFQKCKALLQCSQCSNSNKQTVITQCGHMVCNRCAREMLQTKRSMELKCPMCESRFRRNSLLELRYQ